MVEYLKDARRGTAYEVNVTPEQFVAAVLRTGYFQPPWRINIIPIAQFGSEYLRETVTLRGLSFELACEPSLFLKLLRAILIDFLNNYRSYCPDAPANLIFYSRKWGFVYSADSSLKSVEITVYSGDRSIYMHWSLPANELSAFIEECVAQSHIIKIEMIDRNENRWRKFKQALLKELGIHTKP